MKIKTLHLFKAVRTAFVILLLSMVGLSQVNAQTFTVGDLTYTLNDDGASVTVTGHADNISGSLTIPDFVSQWGADYAVTSIGDGVFWGCTSLTSVSFGNSLKSINYNSFNSCSGLTSITIPESVTFISCGAFLDCVNVTTLYYNAIQCSMSTNCWCDSWLAGCSSLSEVIIGDEVEIIPYSFLDGFQGVTSVSIGHSVKSIDRNAFSGCTGLTAISLPNTLTSIGDQAFMGSGLTSITIPDSMISIGSEAFKSCTNMSSVFFGISLTTIGNSAFENCSSLSNSLIIPNNVSSIGQSAFLGCAGLSGTLTLGTSLAEIGNSAFFGACEFISSLDVLAEAPPTLGNNVFSSVDFAIPVFVPCGSLDAYQNASGWNSFTNIQEVNPCLWIVEASAYSPVCGTVSGAGTFEQGQTCTLTASCAEGWTFRCWRENGVVVSTDIEYSFTVEDHRSLVAYFDHPDIIAFVDPAVEDRCVELWDTNQDGFLSYAEAAAVTSLNYSFRDWSQITSFDELQYFTGLTTIQDWEMSGCNNLISITLPESLTTISYAAFEYSYALQSIVIPESVTYIGGWSFSYCYALTSFVLNSSTPPAISDDVPFYDVNTDNVVFTVPCGAKNTYQNTYVWNWFPNYQEPGDCMYDISVSVVPEESGTVEGAGSYQNGTTCTLTATPADRCSFINWTEDGNVVSTDAEISFPVTGNRNLVANFTLPNYIISASANPFEGGVVSLQGGASRSYDFEDHTFQGWTTIDADGDGFNWKINTTWNSSALGHNGSSDFVMSESYNNNAGVLYPDNYLVSPHVALGGYITFYACTQDSDWAAEHFGMAVSTTGNYNASDFTTIQEWTMTAKSVGEPTAATRSGDRGGQGRWYQYTVDLNAYKGQVGYVAIRHFNCSDKWHLNVDDITFDNLEVLVEQGQPITVAATPNYGYAFVNWEENGEEISSDAELSFTVTGDRDLVANFEKVPFAINATANYDDRGSVTGGGEYVIDATCTVIATPNAGHNFVRWMENGQEVSTEASYSFTVDGPRDLVAVFSAYVDDIIVFADPNAKAVCVNNWDTDFDKELTYAEAAAVTNLNGVFQSHTEIYSFEELQYFTGLTSLNDWEFDYCYNLTSIIIPETVNYMGYGAFSYTGITSITIPEGITYFYGLFMDCYNLASVTFPNSLESIGEYSFSNCSSLESLNLPNTLSYIGDNAFSNCIGLTGVLELPASLTTIESNAFYGCSSLSGLVLPSNLHYIGGSAFRDCTGLRSELTLPESLESVGGLAFAGCDGLSTVNYNATNCYEMGSASEPVFNDCGIEHINIGANVQSIPNFAFRRCSLVTDIHTAAVLPPTIYASTFGMVPRSIPVLVPAGSGDAYRNAPYWEEFFNIMEDGEQYSFHWDVDAHQYAHNLSVIGVIQINGVEQSSPALEIGAFCGDECRGRQMLTAYPELNRSLVFLTVFGEEGDLITFRLYDHEAEEESPLACATVLTFEADAIVGSYSAPEVLNFVEMQNTAIEAGWTWFSTYIDADGEELLEMMEESLGESGVMIKSHSDGFVSYDEFGWDGTLTTVNAESMYMVNTNAPAVMSLAGPFAEASEHPVTLSPEWNWIGFPSMKASSLNNALAGFSAQDGDVIKMQESFSQYIEGIGWMGALKTLVPGEGLMYHSLNNGTTTLTYTVNAKDSEVEENLTAEGNHWTPDVKAYPFNMSVVAVVEIDGVEAVEDRYELAVFADGECRGSVRLMQVAALNRYVAFLTVTGNGSADLRWALYDTETGEEYLDSDSELRFEPNAIVGNVKEPMTVRFNGLTATSETPNKVTCYPNPVSRSQYVRIDLPAAHGETQVEVVNALGAVVSSQRANGMVAEVKAPATAGVYVVRITIDGKEVVYTKLIVE